MDFTSRIAALTMFLLVLAQAARAADTALDKPLADRAAEVQKLFRKDPGGYEKLFAKSFRDAVPDAQLTAIFTQYFKSFGHCTGVALKSRADAATGVYDFTFEKGSVAPVTLSIDPAKPHMITGLLIGNAVKRAGSLDDVIARFKKLPGTTSFLAQQLDGPQPKVLASHNPGKPLAIGSTFKLYIFAELVRQIGAGERKWDDVIKLGEAGKSLANDDLGVWPPDSPLTIHTAAALMISKSDNTATDLLLRTLGREKVEATIKLTGHSAPEKNMPFFSTLEMFKLKYVPGLAETYLAAEGAARRRAMLDTEVAAADRARIAPTASPKLIDKLEWFASAQDLCRAMDWLRKNTEKSPASDGRGILSINPGLTPSRQHFPFVGYKGGSEPGVLNMTFLLKSKSNHWYALSAGWNNPAAPLTEAKFFELVQQCFELLD